MKTVKQKKERRKNGLTWFTKKAVKSEGSFTLMIICLAWQTKLVQVKSPRSFCNLSLRCRQKWFPPAGCAASLLHVWLSECLFGFGFGLGLVLVNAE